MFIINVYIMRYSSAFDGDESYVSESVGPFESEEAALDYAVDRYGVHPFDDIACVFYDKLTFVPVFSIHKVVKP